jgi:hypothetical protein
MPVQQHQVEHPLHQPCDPLANRGARDSVAAGHRRERPAPVDFLHRPQNVAQVVDLARKQIAVQNTLARPAAPAPGQPDAQPPVAGGRLHTPLHPACGQAELVAAAASADTTAKNRVVGPRQDFGIGSTIHREYVDQPRTSKTAPGFVATKAGAVALSAPWGTRSTRREGYAERPSEAMGCDSQKARVTTTGSGSRRTGRGSPGR